MTRRSRYSISNIGPWLAALGALFLIGAVQQFFARNPTAGDKIVTLLWILLGTLIFAVIVLVLGGGVAGVVKMWNKATTVQPDERGGLPVHYRTVRASDVPIRQLQSINRANEARARRALPDGVVHVSTTHNADYAPFVQEPEVLEGEVVPDVPPLSALLRDGAIKPGQFCIGWDGEKFIYGTWEDFCTIGAGGTMGTGKSNDGAFYLAQVLAVGGIGYVADPNNGHSQSLGNRLGRMKELLAAPIAKTPEEILNLVRRVRRLLDQRIDTNDEGETPLILLIDEFTALMLDDDVAKELPKLLSTINTQGRKYGVFVFLLAQLWGAEMTGGTKVRNLLAGRICHNLPMQEARNLLGLPASAMPKDIGSLRRGECYVRTLQGALHRVTIPLVDAQGVSDLRKLVAGAETDVIAEVIAPGLPGGFPDRAIKAVPTLRAITGQSPGNQMATTRAIGPALLKLADVADQEPEFLRTWIVKQLRARKPLSEICKAVHPAAERGGNPYTVARAAVEEVIGEEMGED